VTRLLSFSILLLSIRLYGQAAAPGPPPDVLIFVNGDKLAGHIERATNASVVFKSDMAGELTVPWAKIQELRSSRKFAFVPKGVKLRRPEDAGQVPQGTLVMTGQQVQIGTGAAPPQTMPVADVGSILEEATFEKGLKPASFFAGWQGGATGGISLTDATQKNETYSAAVNLVRVVPAASWLDERSRTIVDFNEAYGKLTEAGSPSVKTSLYHLGVEESWFLSTRIFGFGQGLLDHNYSQGLSLQQTYGAGVGLVVIKKAHQELDFKASADYINQRFDMSSLNQSLIGSTFGETYVRTFAHGILLNEQGSYTPAWNDSKAYSAFGSAALTFPVYHRFGLTLGALDNFLNDPPPAFKKNSFQFTAGATYSLPK
jgi:hypothetical protein